MKDQLEAVDALAAQEYISPGPWGAFRASLVERLHIHPHHRQYSVGTHSGRMGILALELFGERLSSVYMLDLLTCCLQHDLPEFITGDTPGTVKWAVPEIAEPLERLEEAVCSRFGWQVKPTYECNKDRLKALDLLELGMTCLYEEELGNQHVRQVREKVMDILQHRHRKADEKETMPCPFRLALEVMEGILEGGIQKPTTPPPGSLSPR